MIAIGLRTTLAASLLVSVAAGVAPAAVAGAPEQATGPGAGVTASKRWLPLVDSPLERTEVTASRIGKRIYVVGGFVPEGGGTGRMVRYSIRNDRWKEVAPLPIDIHHAGSVSYRGKLYVHGGTRTDVVPAEATARLYHYNPATDRWRRRADSGTARQAHGFEVIGNRIYAAGGSNSDGDQAGLEIYDPHRDRWRQGPPMSEPRHHVGSAALLRRLYVLGGRRTHGEVVDLNVAEVYNPRKRRWRTIPPLAVDRSGFEAVAVSGSVVALGGEEISPPGTTIATVEQYDPENRRWGELAPMSIPRHGVGAVVRRRRVYALEGGPERGLFFSSAVTYLDVLRIVPPEAGAR